MNTKAIEAYNYYKGLYPGELILFHLEGRYVALMDDAKILIERVSEHVVFESRSDTSVAIPEDVWLNAAMKLGNEGFKIRLVAVRNCEGTLDFPDVGLIVRSESEDY